MKEIRFLHSAVVLVEPSRGTDEGTSLVPFTGIRLDQFVSGRRAANQALAKLGITQEKFISRSDEGYPVFPSGSIGSISHSAQLAVSVVAASSDVKMLGVDIELIQPVEESVSPYVAQKGEVDLIGKRYEVVLAPLIVFVIKEAVFKACPPETQAVLWFSKVIVQREISDACYHVSVDPLGNGASLLFNVHTGLLEGHIYAIAVAE